MLPTIETERLILRPRSILDLDACISMDRDPEVTRFIQGPWNEPEQHESFLRDRILRSFGPGLGYWSIFLKEQPNQFLGWILLIPYDGVGPEIEIGWRLVRKFWGHGYATEAARGVAGHAFEGVSVERIIAVIDPRNLGSIQVAEKIGMRPVSSNSCHGLPCSSYVMTQSDYQTRILSCVSNERQV